MIALLFLAWITSAEAAALKLEQVQTRILQELPLVLEAQEKWRAAQGDARSQEGNFDYKLKAKTQNQIETKYDNQIWEARLERQTPYWGSQLFAGHRAGTGLFATYDGKYETSSVGEMFAGVEVPLLRNRVMDEFRLEARRAQLLQELSRIEYHQKSLELVMKGSEVYWKWVLSGLKLRIFEELKKTAEERQGFLEKKVRAGDTGEIRLVDNRRTLNKRNADVVKGEREFEQATLALELYLGRRPDRSELPAQIELSTDHTEAPREADRQQLPFFQVIDMERAILGVEKDFARSQRLPELKLALEGSRDVGRMPTLSGRDQIRVGAMLEIPIENRKALGKIDSVEAKTTALERRTRWLMSEWETRVEQNAVALTTTRKQLKLQDAELADTARMARAEIIRWNQGDSDVFFVNIREQDEAEARMRLIEMQALHEVMVIERQGLDGELVRRVRSTLAN